MLDLLLADVTAGPLAEVCILECPLVISTVFIVFPNVGNHTVAVIKGHEDYDLLKISCSKIFDDINKLIRAGKIKIKDKDVPIEMFVGGDYKVV